MPHNRQGRPKRLRGSGTAVRQLLEHLKNAEDEPPLPLSLREITLMPDLEKAEEDLASILEPALGAELDYWRSRNLSCRDLAWNIKKLYKLQYDNLKAVLVLNNTWHWLHPDMPPFGTGPMEGFDQAAGQAKYGWPDLVPAPLGSCQECHNYMVHMLRGASRITSGKGHAAAAGAAAGGGSSSAGAASSGPADGGLPDALFVLNTADNMERWGRASVAPVLSTQKWWSRPWWPGSTNANTSLGRIDGRLLSDAAFGSMPGADYVPLHHAGVAKASSSSSSGSSSTAGGGAAAAPDLPRTISGGHGKHWQAVLQHMLQRPLSPSAAAVDHDACDMDIMVPQMLDVPTVLHFVPWQDKADVAFFSGTPFCTEYSDAHLGAICLREYMAVLSVMYPRDLRVRMTWPVYEPLGKLPRLQSITINYTAYPRTPIRNHAAYRYLLQLDGFSGSYRMAYLMTHNSAILKSKSPYIEWFSRLQVPGAHYLEFWKDPQDPNDVLKAVSEARHAAEHDMKGVQRAASANQQIASRYLGLAPRLAYFRAAVAAYRGLFPDMDECIADLRKHLDLTGRQLHMP